MANEAKSYATVPVCSRADLERDHRKVVSVNGRHVLVLLDQGQVFALDNRCPHMGFPLNQGTVKDGILTCHWHHAKFDLAGGCTFDPFADDVTSFHVEVRDGQVWLCPQPIGEERRGHWMRKLREGLEQGIRLLLAKSVIGLNDLGVTEDIVRETALFGVRNRARGWSSGLSILTAMANVLPAIGAEDRSLALYQGLVHVARSAGNQPPNFHLEPLATTETRPERYLNWFRHFIEVRAEEAAERTLRTAIHIGLPPGAVADMIFASCTDHLFLDVGHSLDFANKAFELLDHIGWEHAGEVLPSLVPNLVRGQRMEESSSWRHPVDLAKLLWKIHDELARAIEEGCGKLTLWEGHQELAETILSGEPDETLTRMLGLVRQGVSLVELAAAVAYAAARRILHFHVSNEFGDWDTVHHTFTYANAVNQAMRRSSSKLLARGIFDGAMSVHLGRYLNVPKQPIPAPSGASPAREELLAAFDVHGQVNETAGIVADLLAKSQHGEAVSALGHALLREDAEFHQFQIYEAGVRQYRQFAGRPLGDHVLIGVARFLTAHAPSVRAVGQTYAIAARLHRGDALHGGEV